MATAQLLAEGTFRGIVQGPSGTGYLLAPGVTITADTRDLSLLLNSYGCVAAPVDPSGGGGGAITVIGNGGTVADAATVDFGISATVSGSSPNASIAVATSPVLSVEVDLTSAEILGCLASPVPILPAPGAGKAYFVVRSFYSYHFNTIAYTQVSGAGGAVFYGDTSVATNQADLGDSVVPISAVSQVFAGTGPTSVVATIIDNAALVYGIALDGSPASPYLAGDGTMKIIVDYNLITL